MCQEKQLEQKLVKAVKSHGGLCLKFVSPSTAGVPDRLVLIAIGHMAFVEVKAPHKKPRPVQQVMINKIHSLGFRVYVLDDEKQIDPLIKEVIKQ